MKESGPEFSLASLTMESIILTTVIPNFSFEKEAIPSLKGF
jgi:hypothetical protein